MAWTKWNSIKLLALCVSFLAIAQANAAVIEVQWESQGSQPDATGLLTHMVMTGKATSITGFNSLEGIDPSRLTYEGFHSAVYERSGCPSCGPTAHVEFGGSEAEPAYFDIFLDDNRIASSTNPTFFLDTDFTDPSFPSVRRADVPVTGVVGVDFYEEVLQLTAGTGLVQFVSNLSTGVSPTGHFEGTGTIFVELALEGDFDGSGDWDVNDIDLLAAAIRQTQPVSSYDIDGSGQVDMEDFDDFIHAYIGTWYGDANLDGLFNSDDLIDVLAAATYEKEIAATWATGDFNASGYFDSNDLIDALGDDGYEAGKLPNECSWLCSNGRGVSAVPEPTSAVLLLIGMTATSRLRQRRSRMIS